MNTLEKIEVMKAFVEGKTIQCKSSYDGPVLTEFNIVTQNDMEPTWNWEFCTYQIKLEPRIFYLCIHNCYGCESIGHVYKTKEEAVRCCNLPYELVEVIEFDGDQRRLRLDTVQYLVTNIVH